MAVAALAACSKSEVQYEPAGEIGFAPVASNVTKSVAGYNNDTFDGVFPTDVDLYVFAEAGIGDYADTNYDPYFTDALFTWKKGGVTDSVTEGELTIPTTGAYAGFPNPYYWPNVKTVVFAGYSDACNAKECDASMDFANNKLTISEYTQSNYTETTVDGQTQYTYPKEGENDLMWFPFDGTEYDKQANEIIAKMQHACSWITIKVAVDANMKSSNCQLNSLKLNAFYHTGNVVCGADAATWNTLTNPKEEYYLNGANTTLTTTATAYETTDNNFIVIPQEPVMLDVTYTYMSDLANNITSTETKPVSLAYTTTAPTAWQSGVHYIYTITITATEILIDPVVAKWDDHTYDLGNI